MCYFIGQAALDQTPREGKATKTLSPILETSQEATPESGTAAPAHPLDNSRKLTILKDIGVDCSSLDGYLNLDMPCPQLRVDQQLPGLLAGAPLTILRAAPAEAEGMYAFVASQLRDDVASAAKPDDDDEERPENFFLLKQTATPWEFVLSRTIHTRLAKGALVRSRSGRDGKSWTVMCIFFSRGRQNS
jgi:hypothetical protein